MKKEVHIQYDFFADAGELDTTEQMLFEKARTVRENAYAPYSRFLVGCAMLLENGEIVTGSNQENAAFPSGTCAERSAIFWSAANFPRIKIKKMFVVGGPQDAPETSVPTPPCGACRQSILEYESLQDAGIEIYFASVHGEVYKTSSVKDLLPFSFDAKFL